VKTSASIHSSTSEREPSASLTLFAKILIGTALLILGLGILWLLPVLGSTLFGLTNVYWYLSRSSAMVSFFCLWASMALGIGISNKLTRIWPGAFTAFDLHQFTSLLGLGFIGVHVLSLLGDTYIGYTLFQLLVPFASTAYAPLWVGLGQTVFYLLIPVTLSFYARKRLGTRGWRTIHGLSYALFVGALLHGLFSGTDSGSWWATALYGFSAVSLLALTIYRILSRQARPARQAETAPSRLERAG
jgi:predicted ferric reductase